MDQRGNLLIKQPDFLCRSLAGRHPSLTEGKALIATGSPFPSVNGTRIGQCARAVAEMVSQEDRDKGILTPPVTELRKVCKQVALAVGKRAISEHGLGFMLIWEISSQGQLVSTLVHQSDLLEVVIRSALPELALRLDSVESCAGQYLLRE